MLVFRDGRTTVSGPHLLGEFAASVQRVCSQAAPTQNSVMDALLRAGKLECALADAGDSATKVVAGATDELAAALVAGDARLHLLRISDVRVPRTLSVSRPEGFAYYALHPRDFAELADSLPVSANRVAVIGIRSIGTTLSAVVAAQVRRRGFFAERVTVRPAGHPWHRKLELSANDGTWVAENLRQHAVFWIADEGPGLSGSSFLAVGEALVEAGVPCDCITFLGSAEPNVHALRACDAAVRWPRFRSRFTNGNKRTPSQADVSLGAGQWREFFIPDRAEWPATWAQFERAKFLAGDHNSIFKFEGLGSYGAEVRARSQSIAEAGFGPAAMEEEDSYVRYPLVEGKMMKAGMANEPILTQIAEYCAWRATSLAAEPLAAGHLEPMMRTNASEGLGEEFDFPELRIERPAIVDGKMQPHEWRLSRDGRLLKLDAASHGDDHFYPGPTDIVWDLAGAIVEWQMPPQAAAFLLERYRRISGDDPRPRVHGFLAAYSLARLGYCAMAGESLPGTDEGERFQRELSAYHKVAARQLTTSVGA